MTRLDVFLSAFNASNMAALALSNTWSCKPDPPSTDGSKSFSPRFGITGRPGAGLFHIKIKVFFEVVTFLKLTGACSSQGPHPRLRKSSRRPGRADLQILVR